MAIEWKRGVRITLTLAVLSVLSAPLSFILKSYYLEHNAAYSAAKRFLSTRSNSADYIVDENNSTLDVWKSTVGSKGGKGIAKYIFEVPLGRDDRFVRVTVNMERIDQDWELVAIQAVSKDK